MAECNLIDISKREDFKEITSKGGIGQPDTNEKKSLSAKKRWFRTNNPDINALMEYYKEGNQLDIMEKYISDNQRFLNLMEEAKTVMEKNTIFANYMKFQLKIHELMFGTRNKNLNVNVEEHCNKSTSRIALEEAYEKVIEDARKEKENLTSSS